MSNFTKGEGSKIIIKFTDDVIGEVAGNENAFFISGKERKYVNGELVDKQYEIDSVSRKGEFVKIYTGEEYVSPIAASSSSQYSETYSPLKAVDGSIGTSWVSTSKSNQWISFDLGETASINKIKIAVPNGYINTNFDLQHSIDNANWVAIKNGLVITTVGELVEFNFDAIETRFIKLVMVSTSNNSYYAISEVYVNKQTYDIEFSQTDPSNKIIQLAIKPFKRFNNVEGDLTVTYDASKGNLKGEGGFVKSFSATFTPTDLVPLPNPHVAEKFVVMPIANVDFQKIINNYRHTDEKFTVTASCIIDFKYVGIINP